MDNSGSPALRTHLLTYNPGGGKGWRWQALIGYRGQPYLCTVKNIVWRKYASKVSAQRAAERTLAKLGLPLPRYPQGDDHE